jgi:alpha(1,3/1,4) fucosyltransferase
VKYIFLFTTLFLCCSFAKEKEVLLVHNFTPDCPEAIFSPGTPFQIIQENLHKKNISLQCINRETSLLYQRKIPKKSWHRKVHNIVYGEEKNLPISRDPRAYLVFFNLEVYPPMRQIQQVAKDRLILFAFEPPCMIPRLYDQKTYDTFSKIYTWDDDLVDDKKFFKFYYPVLSKVSDPLPPFSERKLCTLVATNKFSDMEGELFSARRKAISYFETTAPSDFDFYGREWDSSVHPCYKGPCGDKIETLKKYRFYICYENTCNKKGYVTEKIFDCFSAGCVPIYWGAPNIEAFIPSNCFIDARKYQNLDELNDFLKNMKEDTYNVYVNNIRVFLESPEAKLFSIEHFTKIFTEAVSN